MYCRPAPRKSLLQFLDRAPGVLLGRGVCCSPAYERDEMNTLNETRGDAVAHLLADAKRFPMLSPERELELALAWRDHADEAALRDLVGSHLRLVIKIARGFTGYGLPIADLIAEGNVGLMQAAQKFDPGPRVPLRDLRDVVGSCGNPGTHSALDLDREDGHYGGAKETVLQSAPAEGPIGAVRAGRSPTRGRSRRSLPSSACRRKTSSR